MSLFTKKPAPADAEPVELESELAIPEQPIVKRHRAAVVANERRHAELVAALRAARAIESRRGTDAPTRGDALRAQEEARRLAPLVDEAELEVIESRDQLERAEKETAARLREIREPEELRRLDELERVLREAVVIQTRYGEWKEDTARVLTQQPTPWLFSRGLTAESVEDFIRIQRAAR